jgi:two-component system chemotaxis response regulator CheB
MPRLRLVLIDDSLVIRKLVADALGADPELEVVGSAANGRLGLERIRETNPDAVVCDVEMPEMNGLETVQALRRTHLRLPVVMFASPTAESARSTLDALHAGANDFLTKPSAQAGTAMAEVLANLRVELGGKIKGLCRGPGDLSGVARAAIGRRAIDLAQPSSAPTPPTREVPVSTPTPTSRELPATPKPLATPPRSLPGPPPTNLVRPPAEPLRSPRPPPDSRPRSLPPPVIASIRPPRPSGRIEAVLIGVSTGGPNALAEVVPRLPRDLAVPVLIVQHMPPLFTRQLAERLAGKSLLAVREAAHGEAVDAGSVLIAPGDQHLTVVRQGGQVRCALNRDPPENSVRPAVDVLFRSAGEVWGGNVLVVVLTGMGQDGLLGAIQLRELGAQVVVQDEASSVVWGMPGAVAKARLHDRMLPLGQIADEITQRARGIR